MRRRTVVVLTLLAVGGIAALTLPGWAPDLSTAAYGTQGRAHVEETLTPALHGGKGPPTSRSGDLALASAVSADVGSVSPGQGEPPTVNVARVSIRIETVDVATGLRTPAKCTVGPFPRIVGKDQASLIAAMELQRWFVEQGSWNSGEEIPVPSGESHVVDEPVTVLPEATYVTLQAEPRLAFERAARIRSLWAIVPLAREAVLEVRSAYRDGRPAHGARVVGLEVAGEQRDVRTESLGGGELRVRGIPFLPGEPVALAVRCAPATEEEVLADALAKLDTTTTIPGELGGRWSVLARVPEPPEVVRSGLLATGVTSSFRGLFRAGRWHSPEPGSPGLGKVRVRGLAVDGTALAQQRLGFSDEATDRQGYVVVPDLPTGKHVFILLVPGRLSASKSVRVRAGETADLELREPQGARLEVLVTDAEGNPRPCARLTVSGKVFDVEDGVQRVDLFTDHRGRRSLARVEPGPRTIEAFWGTRRGSEQVTLTDGETTRITVVAR